jgi:hypothetical protein
MITLLIAIQFHGFQNADPEDVWYAAAVELLIEAVLVSALFGIVFYR